MESTFSSHRVRQASRLPLSPTVHSVVLTLVGVALPVVAPGVVLLTTNGPAPDCPLTTRLEFASNTSSSVLCVSQLLFVVVRGASNPDFIVTRVGIDLCRARDILNVDQIVALTLLLRKSATYVVFSMVKLSLPEPRSIFSNSSPWNSMPRVRSPWSPGDPIPRP